MEALAVLVCHLLVVDAACVPPGYGPPPTTLDDCRRFPDHTTATMLAARAREHWDRCRDIYGTEAERDAYRAWYVLDDVMLATRPDWTNEARLSVLRRLREWLGEEAWYAGVLPPPVPLWAVGR